MSITVTVNDREVRLRLGELARAIEPRSVLNIANQVMQGSIDETFDQEGFPAGSWRRVHASTIRRSFEQRNKGKSQFGKRGGQLAGFTRFATGKKILTDRARLRRSLTGHPVVGSARHEISGNRLTLGTNLIYARTHQEGAVIVPKKAKALAFSIGGGRSVFAKRVVIPARPFLLIKPQDPARIVEAVEGAVGDS